MNKLLVRQIKRYFGSTENIPSNLEDLLNAINETYNHHDQDRVLVERSLEISSEELNTAYSEMRAIFNLFPDIYLKIDNNGRILDLSVGEKVDNNHSYFNKNLIGKYIQEIPYKKVGNLFKAAIEFTMNSKKKVSFEYHIEASEINHYEASLIPIFENNIIIFIKDITYKKQTEEELKIAKEKAEESDRLKSAFLANMSHEIRTPINVIMGFAQLLDEESISNEEKKQFIQTIKSSGDHLLALINDIIDFSKIEAGQLQLNMEECSINSLIFELTHTFKGKEKFKSGQLALLSTTVLPDDNAIIQTDTVRLKQILINLIGNAIKFTHNGSIEFGYQLVREHDENFLQFFVKDTGIGISENNLEKIFDRFLQEYNDLSEHTDGTGLGLTISRELVIKLGGRIWVTSKVNEGSTFYFTIPYTQSRIDENFTQIIEHKNTKTYNLKGKNILLVEDNPNNFIFLNVFLGTKKMNVLSAINGEEAIKKCQENATIDLVLMDLNMPIMNGFEATRKIKKLLPRLPIIAQTAMAMGSDRQLALDAGCDDYISKPIDTNLLLEKISKLVS